MKGIITVLTIFLCLSLGVNSSLGQCTFSVSDFERLCTYNSSDFETSVLKQGFSFWQNSTADTFKIQTYRCDSYNSDGSRNRIERTTKGNGKVNSIGYITEDKEYYADFKSKLLSSGYKFTNEIEQTVLGQNTVEYYYSNSKFRVIVYSYLDAGTRRYSIMFL